MAALDDDVPRVRPRRTTLALTALALAAVTISLPLAVHAATVFTTYLVGQVAHGDIYPSDFLNYYSAARMLLEYPHDLYRPDFETAFRRSISGGLDVYSQFQNLPSVAALFVPLALLPFGWAYLVWSALNLCWLALSARLLAPSPFFGWWSGWPLWFVLSLCYVPAQLALLEGQTSFVMLCGFCLWVWFCERGHLRSAPLWLLTWAWKPQLLPVPLLGLVLSRAVSRALAVVAIQVVALGLVLVWTGYETLGRYVELTRSAAQVDTVGKTVFALPLLFNLTGVPATVAAVAAACAVWAATISLWWGGPRPDERRWLQFAALPVAAVIVAVRAYSYELTLWLASAWLLLRFAAQVDRGRWLVVVVLLGVWWTSIVATFAGEAGDPWGGLTGVVLLGTITWQFHAWQQPRRRPSRTM